MKKAFTLLLAAVAALTMTAQPLQVKTLPFNGKIAKTKMMTKGANLKADELITPPATATIETDWAITGNYINNSNPYENGNAISVAFDGTDVYIQGMSFLCPTAWVKGTIDGTTVTFAANQYLGTYSTYTMYLGGSNDGSTLSDVTFTYDANAKSFTLSNYYIENTSTTEIAPVFYSTDLVVYKDIIIPTPSNPTAEPAITTANVAWTENGEATKWNLRYRPFVDLSGSNRFWDFEDVEQVKEFTIVDADNDGNAWDLETSKITTNSGTNAMISKSYDNNKGALTPDNWLITPLTTLGGTFSFYACGQDDSYYGEVFAVYVFAGEEMGNVSDFVKVSDDFTATATMTKYDIDLSAYEGKGYIAIRHYNITDMFYLNVDDITITVPENEGKQAAEWTVVETENNPYTIEGLTAETTYEFAVQATTADGNSDWSESAFFTTLAEEPQPTHTYTVAGSPAGFFGTSWDPTIEANNMTLNAETGKYEWTSTEATLDAGANVEFKVTEDHSWDVSYGLNGGADNVVLTAEKAGKYTLTVYFDPQNNNNVTGELTFIEEAVVEHTYTVAGSPAGFFGTEWDTTNEANDMTLNAETGKYEWTSTEATLDAGANVEFKVTEDHSWDVSYGLNGGGDNVVLTAEKAGKYTLTVYFDPQNKNVTGELTLIEEIVPEYSEFYLVGEKINSWSTTENRVALEAKEGGIYEATLNLEAGQDGDFKVIAFDEAGAMAWFGGADENNVGFFLLNNDMLGINISLAYGSAGANFRPEVAGNYTIQVFEKPATTGLKAASEPLVMKVVKNSDTAIETISTSAVDNTWYNLQGVKFNGKPSVPGIYINGGKKVIVK